MLSKNDIISNCFVSENRENLGLISANTVMLGHNDCVNLLNLITKTISPFFYHFPFQEFCKIYNNSFFISKIHKQPLSRNISWWLLPQWPGIFFCLMDGLNFCFSNLTGKVSIYTFRYEKTHMEIQIILILMLLSVTFIIQGSATLKWWGFRNSHK